MSEEFAEKIMAKIKFPDSTEGYSCSYWVEAEEISVDEFKDEEDEVKFKEGKVIFQTYTRRSTTHNQDKPSHLKKNRKAILDLSMAYAIEIYEGKRVKVISRGS